MSMTDQIESIVDKHGIESVLMALSTMCGEKGNHVATNWQDKRLAHRWYTLEGAIGVIVPKANGI